MPNPTDRPPESVLDVEEIGPHGEIIMQVENKVDLSDLALPEVPKIDVTTWVDDAPLDLKDHPMLSAYVFRWLSPRLCEKNGMRGWKFCSGDMSRAVRRCGILGDLIGGEPLDESITNGDLVLGWMPTVLMDARKEYYKKLNSLRRASVTDQGQFRQELAEGPNQRYVEQEGRVDLEVRKGL